MRRPRSTSWYLFSFWWFYFLFHDLNSQLSSVIVFHMSITLHKSKDYPLFLFSTVLSVLGSGLRQWSSVKLKQQDKNIRITINRYLKTEEFVLTIRFDMKKDKKEETLSFIEEAWICRTGAILQRFSIKRRQARGKRESESRARGVKKKHERTPYPYAH